MNEFKSEFSVYSLSGSMKYMALIAKLKPTEQNSGVESDMVKLMKQIKETVSSLFGKGVKSESVWYSLWRWWKMPQSIS